jgi:hypothetical protein
MQLYTLNATDLPLEGRLLVSDNMNACETCGTMRTVVAALGNFKEIYALYIGNTIPLAFGTPNNLYNRLGLRVPALWQASGVDTSAGKIVTELVPLVDRLRVVRQRGRLNCGFDASVGVCVLFPFLCFLFVLFFFKHVPLGGRLRVARQQGRLNCGFDASVGVCVFCFVLLVLL